MVSNINRNIENTEKDASSKVSNTSNNNAIKNFNNSAFSEYQDSNLMSDETQHSQISKDERNIQNNANNLRNAADIAIATKNPYAMAAGAAVKAADKLTGGKSSELIGKSINTVNKIAPGGRKIQKLSNKLNESGASDVAGSVARAKNFKSGGAGQSKIASNIHKDGPAKNGIAPKTTQNIKEPSDNSEKQDKFQNLKNSAKEQAKNKIKEKLIKKLKRKASLHAILPVALIFVGILGIVLIFMLIIMGGESGGFGTADATYFSNSQSSGFSTCTSPQIESSLLYVGDSRTVGLQSSITEASISYIAKEGEGYSWLSTAAKNELTSKLENGNIKYVVFALGINDLGNIDSYINIYNSIKNTHTDIHFYFMSVNPIDLEKATSNGYFSGNTDPNGLINTFNQKLSDTYGENYLDTYSEIADSIETDDGLHYKNTTYQKIHKIVIDKILSISGNSCNQKNYDTCALSLVNGTYYRKQFPQTDSCNVTGFFDDNEWGLDPTFYQNLTNLLLEGEKNGHVATICSGYRSRDTQKYLYNCYLTGTCNNGNLAAVPGKSNHEFAIAADLNYAKADDAIWYRDHAQNYGLHFPIFETEDWHLQPINIIDGNPTEA